MVLQTLNCNNCKHEAKGAYEAPCLTCSWWGNWEAKQTRTCETCLHWHKDADEAPCVTCTMERASWEPKQTQQQQFVDRPLSMSIDEYIERIGKGEMTVEQGLNGTTAKDLYDTISKPKHYMLFEGEGIEVRDVIEKLVEKIQNSSVRRYALEESDYVQLMQYLMRFMDKNGVEDLKKARWYLDKMIESY